MQPDRMKTGITSSLKLSGPDADALRTVTGTETFWPANSTSSRVWPSASGTNVVPSSLANLASATTALAFAVTSCVTPSARVATTMNR